MLEKVSMGECSLGWMMSLAQVAMDAPQGTQGEGGGGVMDTTREIAHEEN